nr:MAG: hypothetical protein [Molluscum contagiosum virus]
MEAEQRMQVSAVPVPKGSTSIEHSTQNTKISRTEPKGETYVIRQHASTTKYGSELTPVGLRARTRHCSRFLVCNRDSPPVSESDRAWSSRDDYSVLHCV